MNDHGIFVPLKVMFPEADIPILQLSLQTGLDPARHIAIGNAISSLRSQNVLIIGSGLSFHNLSAMGDPRALTGPIVRSLAGRNAVRWAGRIPRASLGEMEPGTGRA
jgi:aromatic ring-opening dioxygenase catalytic subunit (LigB family)